ncbi:MAG: ABC transporter ATP-binding protein [Bacteroidales bacterium]|nr:ABC transporter ATP-binding protein [Bacteroidales bacterium]
MNYNLNIPAEKKQEKKSSWSAVKTLVGNMVEEKRILIIAFIAMIITAVLNLLGPIIIGRTVDIDVQKGDYHGLLVNSAILFSMYLIAMFAGYIQTKLMGSVGQRMLFTLRNSVFDKLQELPVDFFNQNKAGDLISRINNDTEKINQFFSQSLMQFIRFILIMIGSGIFLLSINFWLGLAALSPAIFIFLFTRFVSPWVKSKNSINMKSTGSLSSEVQESLNNFNVIVAFNRRDYFRKRFETVNQENYRTSILAGVANNVFMPVYTFLSNIGQMIVLFFGIYLISKGQFSIGLLISFLAYISSFYNPLRQLASLWSSFQTALAAWDRILVILNMENNMKIAVEKTPAEGDALLEFKKVSFSYPNGKEVLHNISFRLEAGKTYAFVGPTGGGKTTTANLIARLYDPTKGTVLYKGFDIRSFDDRVRTKGIGFILQDPFLFTGSVKENILYGNEEYKDISNEELEKVLNKSGLNSLIKRFDKGLETPVQLNGDGISLGQKQLLAFMRAVLRNPDILILDEATANIDTVTEKQLDHILKKLPSSTTLVIIAHRLNTIENADEIYFVNTGKVQRAGSLKDAMDLLLGEKNNS